MIKLKDTDKLGVKITTDSLLLAEFVKVKDGERVLEIGTGSGGVALLIASKHKASILGIDVSPANIAVAEDNLRLNREALQGEVEFLLRSATSMMTSEYHSAFDVVVSNPPFYRAGAGRISPISERATARQEIAMTLEELFKVSNYVLRHKGRLFLIHIPERLDELFGLGSKYKLGLKIIQPVYTKRGKEAKRILLMAQKGLQHSIKILLPIEHYETSKKN